jgi:hypothetical protein
VSLAYLKVLDKPENDVKYKNSLAYFGIISDGDKRGLRRCHLAGLMTLAR